MGDIMNEKKIVKKRALRRHHAGRLKKRAKQVFKQWDFGKGMSKGELDEAIGRFHNNLAKCSCSMCGNPRKYGEKTVQERRAEKDILDGFLESLYGEGLLEGEDDYDSTGWCNLCEKEIVGQCPTCGYTIKRGGD